MTDAEETARAFKTAWFAKAARKALINDEELCEAIAEVRKGQGVTQVQLAAKLGKPQSHISKVERGERRLDVVEFTRWIDAIGGSPPTVYQTLLNRLKALQD